MFKLFGESSIAWYSIIIMAQSMKADSFIQSNVTPITVLTELMVRFDPF